MSVEAFSLLTLNNVALVGCDVNEHGFLCLECVTVPMPQPQPSPPGSWSSNEPSRDVFLLRANAYELPVNPTKLISVSVSNAGARIYTLHDLHDPDDHSLVLTLCAPPPSDSDTGAHVLEDTSMLHGILG